MWKPTGQLHTKTSKSSDPNDQFVHSVIHRFAGISGSVDSHMRAAIYKVIVRRWLGA